MKSKATPTPPPPFVAAVFKGAAKTVRAEQLREKREKDKKEREKKQKTADCKKAWEPVIQVVEEFRRIFYGRNCQADRGLRIDGLNEYWKPTIRLGYDIKFQMQRVREASGDTPATYVLNPSGSMPVDCPFFGNINAKNMNEGTTDTKDFIPGMQLFIADLMRKMPDIKITKEGVFRGSRKLI